MKSEDHIANILEIKDPNITVLDYKDAKTHKEVIAKLDYSAPKCPNCLEQMSKYDFQKESKVPYLESAGFKIIIRLKKRWTCKKMAVAPTSIILKNHQIPTIIKQKVAQLLIETVSMTAIADRLAISTSTVIRKLNDFQFKTDLTWLPETMP